MFRRTMLYLGLGADEDYDEFGQPQRGAPAQPAATPAVSRPRPVPPSTVEPGSSVRTLPPEPAVRPVPAPATANPASAPGAPDASSSGVRTVVAPSQRSPTVITPKSFNEAKQIGDHFKNRQPVIINLQDLAPDLGHRLVDFAAGLIYALDGQMEKVANNVFLLKPANIEVGDDDRRRLAERGLAD
ncbi:MAG: cell division protein SepF [Actinomycetota bacterium]